MELVLDKAAKRGTDALRNAVKGGNKFQSDGDWINETLSNYVTETPQTKTVTEKDDKGKEVTKTVNLKPKKSVDVDGLIALAKENGKEPKTYPNPGMYRMNIGNMLRAVAKKRGGITMNGQWAPAPKEFLGKGWAAVEDREGNKIKTKVEKEQKKAA